VDRLLLRMACVSVRSGIDLAFVLIQADTRRNLQWIPRT
jgi:hypothetical protein